jgi:hypothetical protein
VVLDEEGIRGALLCKRHEVVYKASVCLVLFFVGD